MPKNVDWEPLGIHYALMELAKKYGISRKEVKITIMRVELKKLGALKCDHTDEHLSVRPEPGRARSDTGSLHCKWCWTWTQFGKGSKETIDAMGRQIRGKITNKKPIISELEEALEKQIRITIGDDQK